MQRDHQTTSRRRARTATRTRRGRRRGLREGVPIALGVGGYDLAFGALARDAGLSVAEATLMSATVLAGAAQFVAIVAGTSRS